MKKIIKIFSIIGLLSLIPLFSGCSNDSMDNITVYTTVYPVEFVTKKLYGNHGKIFNMYPQGINPYKYKFTKKQISDYGNSNLVIYNGLSDEKDNVVSMINQNKNLKIIDATNNIEYTYSLDEIWINPSNVLMIAQNIKDGLKEYVDSDYTKSEINNAYEELKISISNIDADLKEMVENTDKKKIIVQNNEFTFLNKYGLEVISLDDSTITDKTYTDAMNAVSNDDINYIYIIKDQKTNETVNKIMKEFPNLEIIELDTINNISTEDKKEGIDYITIMNDNIDKLKQELY